MVLWKGECCLLLAQHSLQVQVLICHSLACMNIHILFVIGGCGRTSGFGNHFVEEAEVRRFRGAKEKNS